MTATKEKPLKGLWYIGRQTAQMFASDDFVDPEFVWPGTDRDEFEGWFNEATFLFNQYFMQEPKLQEALEKLVNKQATINIKRAISLFKNSGIRIDARITEYADRYVSAHEIIEDFLLGDLVQVLGTRKEQANVEKS